MDDDFGAIFGCLLSLLAPLIAIVVIVYVAAFAIDLALSAINDAINAVLEFLENIWNPVAQILQRIIQFFRELFKRGDSGRTPAPDKTVPSTLVAEKPTDESKCAGLLTYTVIKGDTLAKIAKEFNTTVEVLVEYNKKEYPSLEERPELIEVGWVLCVPSTPASGSPTTVPAPTPPVPTLRPTPPLPSRCDGACGTLPTYTVVSGDTLSKIAKSFNTSSEEIVRLNNANCPSLESDPSYLKVGWVLCVPSSTELANTQPSPWDTSWFPSDSQSIASKIDSILDGTGLSGQGSTILQYAQEFGVNPAFALAMFRKEASFAASGTVANSNKNPGNIICKGGTKPLYGATSCAKGFGVYATMADGIKAYFWLLNAEYRPGGAISRNCQDITCIIKAYCPPGKCDPTGKCDTDCYIAQVTEWTRQYQNQLLAPP